MQEKVDENDLPCFDYFQLLTPSPKKKSKPAVVQNCFDMPVNPIQLSTNPKLWHSWFSRHRAALKKSGVVQIESEKRPLASSHDAEPGQSGMFSSISLRLKSFLAEQKKRKMACGHCKQLGQNRKSCPHAQ